MILFLFWKWRKYNKPLGSRQVLLLVALLVLTVMFSWIPSLPLPMESASPPPGVPMEPNEPLIMVLAAVPWVLAAGLLGLAASRHPGSGGRFLNGLWQTHSLFTALETAFLAVLFCAALRQNYRTTFYRLLRHPLAAAILLALLFPFIHLVIMLLSAQGILVSRLDYGLRTLASACLDHRH